jgi:hypothetical protein
MSAHLHGKEDIMATKGSGPVCTCPHHGPSSLTGAPESAKVGLALL